MPAWSRYANDPKSLVCIVFRVARRGLWGQAPRLTGCEQSVRGIRYALRGGRCLLLGDVRFDWQLYRKWSDVHDGGLVVQREHRLLLDELRRRRVSEQAVHRRRCRVLAGRRVLWRIVSKQQVHTAQHRMQDYRQHVWW